MSQEVVSQFIWLKFVLIVITGLSHFIFPVPLIESHSENSNTLRFSVDHVNRITDWSESSRYYLKWSAKEFLYVILFPERREVEIFPLNRYVNAPYEWPILKGWGNAVKFSCLDRPSKLRHKTQNQWNSPKKSYNPADFRHFLQFTCDLMTYKWNWLCIR